ncbi:Zn-clus multi-domain protein [Pyrenophora tritici-repentis]|uniref:Fungal Zn binuclear cluster domain containing protein n=2 Tax=Pyrenophora tritici-repentis TaxID=45151 RepID=A0A2W1HHP6_9PLEO|nr:uncharacterized protein PTRG_01524 [Pyrenophora tritici-repentis Pt-1C-BFP]KAA8626188.1 Zn-clus multi-domain protein [Pyrenophora tritici-repentis]EDU40962.1 predicted protein [Pyrenophora tritici-repentis Pt-1C-BFP]KAF7454599.1 Zn-clus multi-domain protein [Pyrenophora tritici-repentis]KAF7577722.1 Zn-clus multi-domain protein [Pyrenophora tritici-repentis]KAG9388353.1 Zn-clus multi-domain protein [Pyrenophora tritici-repentis]
MATYADPDAQMGGGPGQYPSQNGTPPAQHQLTDPELRLQENLQQLREGGDMMHTAGPQQPQYQPLTHMGPAMGAHPHFQGPARPTHSPQQMAQHVMNLEGHHDPYDPNDPSRKRSKVSRACDECRRKKIRCDATSENGPEACSSCKRTGARCQFSRQPMKRGPSKGYIKELADRLNSLESQIHHPPNQSHNFDFGSLGDQTFADTQSPPQFKRQRTHSMTDGFHEAFSRPNWSGQDRGNGGSSETHGVPVLSDQESSLNGNRRTSFGDLSLGGSLITGSNEETLKAYYNIIHPTLPILPHHESQLNRLTNCPPKLRETFFLTLEGCIRSLASKSLPPIELSLNQLLQQCFTSVDAANYCLHDTDSSRQFYNQLVWCQSMILLAVASDRPGPGVVGSTTALLARISACIVDAGINDSRTMTAVKEQDQEVFQTARRVYWTAFILDRFHASSRSKDMMIRRHAGTLSRDDYSALGEVGYYLARTAQVVGRIAYVNRAGSILNVEPAFAFSALKPGSAESEYLSGTLDQLKQSIELTTLTRNSPPHLAHQYLRLFIARLSLDNVPSVEVFHLAKELLGNLASGAITPLHHIFAALVATSLTELSDRVEMQVDAHASIKEMTDALSNGQIIHRSSDGFGWETAIRDLLHQKKASTPPYSASEQASPALEPNMAGLQHLAAAAVGEREGTGDNRPDSSSQQKVDNDLSAAMAAASEAAKAQAQATAAAAQDLFH